MRAAPETAAAAYDGNVAMSANDGQGLTCEAVLPLRWQEENSRPGNHELALLDARNEDVLKIIYALDEQLPDGVEEQHGQTPDLAALEFKLNLLFDLVSQLLSHYIPLPPPRAAILSAGGLEWRDAEPPPVGAELRIEFYLSGRYPRPLTLFGTVESVIPDEAGSWVALHFDAMGTGTQAWLEKLIFRHHRRSVAHARRSAGSDDSSP